MGREYKVTNSFGLQNNFFCTFDSTCNKENHLLSRWIFCTTHEENSTQLFGVVIIKDQEIHNEHWTISLHFSVVGCVIKTSRLSRVRRRSASLTNDRSLNHWAIGVPGSKLMY
jgi:hypothetical protein